MRAINYLWITILGAMIIGSGLFFGFRASDEKKAFFDVDKVYEQFDMKKELEAKMHKMEEYQNFFIDSLKFQIRALESKAISNPNDQHLQSQIQRLYEQFRLTANDFAERNQSVADQYNKQVLKQIIEKAKTYREQKGLSLFMGKSEGTDLIFYDETYDLTAEFIEYLNKNYSGGMIESEK